MKSKVMLTLLAVCLATGGIQAQTPSNHNTHSRQYWRQIAAAHYALPAGEKAFPLAQELSHYLASPDPELRDDLAYSILDTWLVRQKLLSSEELLSLLKEWQGNLRVGIGEAGTGTVFQRSFSALCLASLTERD